LVVAINKIDLPAANVQKVKQDLLSHQVVLEEFGGTTLATPISAKTGQNVDALLDQILLQAELLDLKANPDRRAHGTVLEATLDPGKGPVATILVQNGTLRVGDDFICGQFSGRVRAMYNERGETVTVAGPSTPVQILGFEGVPEAGDTFSVMADAGAAREIAQKRQRLEREAQHRRTGRVKTLEDFMAERAAGGAAALRIIIKADQGGPAEALADALAQLSTPEVKVEVVHRVVRSGVIPRTARVRVIRDGVEVYEGGIASLKRFKDDVREVREGFECGIGIEGFNDIKVGDLIEAYKVEEVARSLTPA